MTKQQRAALSLPAILCAITFCTNLVKALSDGNIDSQELHTLLASADGFESVFLFLFMYLSGKK